MASAREFSRPPPGIPVIEAPPQATAYTPDSVLNQPPPTCGIHYAGDRPRLSTCSGVAWMPGGRLLLAVNMHDCSIQVYAYDPDRASLESTRKIGNADGARLLRPETIALSPDGRLAAVPNMGSGQLNLYRTDLKTGLQPRPLGAFPGKKGHGARFSRCGHYLAYACVSDVGLLICSLRPPLRAVQRLGLPFFPLKPKSLDFSLDGRFVVIGHCVEVIARPTESRGLLTVHRFDSRRGQIEPTPLHTSDAVKSTETVRFHPSAPSVYCVDQVNDRVVAVRFDPETGAIGSPEVALSGPESTLDIPHGIDFSPDGRFAAITHYGDDKLTIHRVSPARISPIATV